MSPILRTIVVPTMALAWIACALAACEDPPKVPYIKPDLANWTTPYRGVEGLSLQVFETGKLQLPERLLQEGGQPTRTREIAVPAYALRHPREGWVVINPGLAAEAEKLGGAGSSVLAQMLAIESLPSVTLPEQLSASGIEPNEVRWVLLTSLSAVHAGTLDAFPEATVVVSRAARRHALRGTRAERLDAITRWRILEFDGTPPLGTFPHHIDLFDDGSVVAIEAAGAIPGATIFLLRLPDRPVLLAAGLAETDAQVRYAARPGNTHDAARWWQRIWELKRFRDLAPELLVVPGSDVRPLAETTPPLAALHPTPEVQRPRATPTPADDFRRFWR